MLEFVDGQDQERMLAIDSREGYLVVDNFKRDGFSMSTGFTLEEADLIINNPNNVIIMHNHSYNRPPSGKGIQEFAREDKVKLSLSVAHDGNVYAIISASKECISLYIDIFTEVQKITDNKEMQKLLATKRLYDENEKKMEVYSKWRCYKYGK